MSQNSGEFLINWKFLGVWEGPEFWYTQVEPKAHSSTLLMRLQHLGDEAYEVVKLPAAKFPELPEGGLFRLEKKTWEPLDPFFLKHEKWRLCWPPNMDYTFKHVGFKDPWKLGEGWVPIPDRIPAPIEKPGPIDTGPTPLGPEEYM